MMDTSRPGERSALGSGRTARWLALGGVAGPVLLVLAFSVAGLLRPGYSPVRQAISDLGVGANAWILNAALLANGVLLLAFVVGFVRTLPPAAGAWSRGLCAGLLLLSPLGFAVAGVFTEAPATLAVHSNVGANLAFFGAVAGFLATGLVLRRIPGWRGTGTVSLGAAALTFVLIIVMFAGFAPGTPLGAAGLAGLLERLVVVEILATYAVLAWRAFRERP